MASFVAEFAGARGAGKSTLRGMVEEEFARRGQPVGRLEPPSLARRARARAVSIVAYLRAMRALRRLRPGTTAERRGMAKRFWRYRYTMALLERAAGVFLLDEGAFQLTMMLSAQTDRKDVGSIVETLSGLTPLPDLVVVVNADEPDIEARRRTRANTGDRRKPHVSERGRAALLRLNEYLREDAGAADRPDVIFVTNTDMAALASAAAAIVEHVVERHARSTAGVPDDAAPTASSAT